jgi:hypothetical protein
LCEQQEQTTLSNQARTETTTTMMIFLGGERESECYQVKKQHVDSVVCMIFFRKSSGFCVPSSVKSNDYL